MDRYYIVCNGVRSYLDEDKVRVDLNLHFSEGGDQCEDCGKFLAETGVLLGLPWEGRGASVECAKALGGCDSVYEVKSRDVPK